MIRFQRVGRRNDPAFRIVVTEKRSKPRSSGLEQVGSYHPKTKHVVLKNDRILHWISRGAKTSATVHNVLVRHGVIRAKKRAAGPVAKTLPSAPDSAHSSAPTQEALPAEAASS